MTTPNDQQANSLAELARQLSNLDHVQAADDATHRAEYSIDQLAQAGNSTVRNVRAYQDRGLLPAPERRGRAGVYTDVHLARLNLINHMLERGYTLANIHEMLNAWEKGQDLGELMGLESALSTPWTDELPDYLSPEQLLARFPEEEMSGSTLELAIELGVVVPEKQRFRIPSPRLLNAGAELVEAGIPLRNLLLLLKGLRGNIDKVAAELTHQASRLLEVSDDKPIPQESVHHLTELVWRLRPLALVAVQAEVQRAMHQATQRYLGDRINAAFQGHQDDPDKTPEQ
ncbi:MAG: MerR family transcriptional regulator [Oleiphilaceae bacterium]|nr:MerR family transcriptional regulator [Oleiphilaceae bacterium]